MGSEDTGNTDQGKREERDLYQRNLNALRKHHPQVAEIIEPLHINEDRFKVLKSESGVPRVLHINNAGEEIYIHSAVDPADCAHQAVDILGQMEKEGIAVLFGFGLGYFADEILKRFAEGHIMMVYEATPEIFKIALQERDLSRFLASGKVQIFLGHDVDNFSILQRYHHLIVNGKFWVVKHHPSIRLSEKTYDRFFKRLTEEKRITESGIATAIGLGKSFMNTYMENIPSILKRPGVKNLKDIFKKRPAIIVSAGPSLEKNFHLLKKAKGRAVIIAVDVVLPTLLPAGILPDIVVAIDPLADNTGMFRDNPLLKDVPFICFGQFTPEIVRLYPGPLFINSGADNAIHSWLGSLWEDRGYVACFGGSVSHFAFGVAEYIGADVTAMIGSDLSFKNEKKYHAGDTTKLLQEAVENPDYDAFKGGFEVKDIFDEKVYALHSLLVFKTSFENKIRIYDGKVINATEGGLHVDGALTMRLEDFIDEYCDLPATDVFGQLSTISEESSQYDLDGIIEAVTVARDKLREIKQNSNRVLKHIKKIKALKKRGQKDTAEFHNILDKIDSTIEKIKHPVLNLIAAYHYGLEIYLKKQEMQEIDEMKDDWERLEKQLQRGTHYYTEVVRATDHFNKHLNKLIEALKVEKKVDSALVEEPLEKGTMKSIADIYEKAGMIAQAVRYLELARKTDSNAPDEALESRLAGLYIKQFRFFEARELLEKLRNREHSGVSSSKADSRINQMLQTCNGKIREWKERTKRMGELLEQAETHYGTDLETGYFYFRTKDFMRAEGAYLKAVHEENIENSSRQSASFYGLAHTYLAMDNPEDAFNELEKAIEVEPDNPIFYRDLGFIAFQNNDVSSAEIFFSKAIELKPDLEELYKPLADLYVVIGEKAKAIALFERALLDNPDNPVIQKDLAEIYKAAINEEQKEYH